MLVMKTVITKLREHKGITQSELARRLGMSRQAVSQLENGDRQAGLPMLERFSKVTSIPVSKMLKLGETYEALPQSRHKSLDVENFLKRPD